MCVLYNVMCERPCDPLTSIPLQELLVNPATSLRLICQTAECRLPVIGACYRFMGVDEKVGSTDESEDVWESIHLSGAPVTGRGRKGGGGRDEPSEQAHLYVWLPETLCHHRFD